MKKTGKLLMILFLAAAVSFAMAAPSQAEVNDSDLGLELRGALGAGQVLWGYVYYSSETGDFGTGPGGTINLAALLSYKFIGLEANILAGSTGDLEWTDEDDSGNEVDFKSKGSGSYSVLDLKLGLNLFREPGDMGHTFIYGGLRYWSTSREQDTLEADGNKIPEYSGVDLEGNGSGWIVGFRDLSTIGANDGFAIAIQTGFFFGKAPVDTFKVDGDEEDLTVNESATVGGELAGGIALQNLGFLALAGFRGEVNATTFDDSVAPSGEESAFGFGNITFFVEAQLQF
ncbi:MAG: hypothetical protein ACOCX9_06665 [Spirochaetota bacterium]